jgi:hypothetical protein
MLNEVEMAQTLLRPFCVLKGFQLFSEAGSSQSASGFERRKRIRTRGECSGGAAVLGPYSLVVETVRRGTLLRRTFFRLVIQG